MKKIISWNVASVRARMPLLIEMLQKENPDIVFLQEIKVEEEAFPFLPLKELGYNAYISGQKAWNGVAILSKEDLEIEKKALTGFEDQARFIDATDEKGIHFISVYVPNGQAPAKDPEDTSRLDYKIAWISALKGYLKNLKGYVVGGDFNVIFKDEDVYNPATFEHSVLMLPCVRKAFAELLELPIENPLRDKHEKDNFYTFWDFQWGAWRRNNGIFLDYIFPSSDIFKNKIHNTQVLKDYRGLEKPSDHVPVCVELDY